MDSTSLSLCRALCCINDGQRQVFDLVFQRYILGDELGHYRKVLDKVVEDCNMLTTAMASVYSFLFPSLNFDVDNDEDELMAALIVALPGQEMKPQQDNFCDAVSAIVLATHYLLAITIITVFRYSDTTKTTIMV